MSVSCRHGPPLRSGVNSCIFAYGQTGSGKTYSMMGDMPQLETDKVAATTNSSGLPPSSKRYPENLGKCETVETNGAKISTAGNNSTEGKSGTEVAGDRAAGVIPRAVDDIFRIVREGGLLEEAATTPLPSAPGRYSFRGPPQDPQPPPAETAVPSPSTARGSGFASAPNTSSPGTSESTRSRGSSSSEDSLSTHVPSAAHWPLAEPTIYVPRAQIPRDGSFSSARQQVQPYDDSKNHDAGGMEESCASNEKLKAGRREHGETIATCKYAVQCSYMQVRHCNEPRYIGTDKPRCSCLWSVGTG